MMSYGKRKIALRYWLLAKASTDREYYGAVRAMDFMMTHHTGTRNDGVTPNSDHQISVVHYLRTLGPLLIEPVEALIAGFLHDTMEDTPISFEEIENRFGRRVAVLVELLSKEIRGLKKSTDEYFAGIAQDPTASIVKCGDRIHNNSTSVGVFTKERLQRYVVEGNTRILPMVRLAQARFPEQELAYQNVKTLLRSQLAMLEAVANAA